MEGSTWLRFGAIAALLLGALYVLAPSLLADGEVHVDASAATGPVEPPLQLWLDASDGEADPETAAVVKARLLAAGQDIDDVVAEGPRVVVYLRKGATKPPMVVIATPAGAVSLFRVEDLVDVEGQPVRAPAPNAAAITTPYTVEADGTDATLVFSEPLAEDIETLVVRIDGRIFGTATVGDDRVRAPIQWTQLAMGGATGILVGGEIEESIVRWTAPVVEAEDEPEDEAVEVVAWWEPLLLDTKLNLGLDLQGGIDMTLQVDQDAAVFSSVQRDARVLQDQAVKDGIDAIVRRDRTRPAVMVHATVPFDELSDLVNGVLREYAYLESVPVDGKEFHVWRMQPEVEVRLRDQAVEQNLETLRKRVDGTGVKEPSIVKMDGGRINIQLPGVEDANQATAAIGTQATLGFRMVDEEADTIALDRSLSEAEKALPADQFADHTLVNEWLHENGKLARDRVVRWNFEETAEGTLERALPLVLIDDIVLTGADVDDASTTWDQNNIPHVVIDFKPRGANVFCDVTRANVGKQFAILLDEQIRSAPSIREAICGGSASIEMGTSADALQEANTLALVLRSGALTAPVVLGEVRQIGASLGADAIESGRMAAGVGGFVTLLFMGLWYGRPGLIADIALVLNVLLVFALLALFGATLTLPGIAGVALTIGMAVDANIIIYERIREELKLGVTPRKAVDAGYDKGIVAVLDANITTAIAGVVLYSYGTGPIRGFAVTLLIGIFTTLVTALFVTRTFMEALTRSSTARLRI